MANRNFRVKNGLSVGDIVIDASANTITGLTTAAPSADGDVANKKYVDDSLSGLSQNSIAQLDSSVAVTDTGADGAITITADNSAIVVVNASGAAVTGTLSSSGNFDVATNKFTVNATSGDTAVAGTLGVTGAATFSDTLTVTGNLTVNGTTTTVNSTNTTLDDNLLELNSGAASNANDSGIIIERGSTGDNAVFMWDESEDTFTLGTTTATASDTGDLTITVGTLVANLTGTATAAQYSDVAERFASDSMYEPGTVVALGGAAEITAVAEEASDEVFGVVSGTHQAAFKMNGGAGSDETHPYIAMTGRVDVKVIGKVNKGDRLISAPMPGYARAATKAECTAFNVIGRALTSKNTSGTGTVLAAVRVSH